MGVGGDNRAADKGTHVREPRDRGVRLGPAAGSSNVSTTFRYWLRLRRRTVNTE